MAFGQGPVSSFWVLQRMKQTSGLLGCVGAGVGITISGCSSGFLTSTQTKVFSSFCGNCGMIGAVGAGGDGALMNTILQCFCGGGTYTGFLQKKRMKSRKGFKEVLASVQMLANDLDELSYTYYNNCMLSSSDSLCICKSNKRAQEL